MFAMLTVIIKEQEQQILTSIQTLHKISVHRFELCVKLWV